CDSSVASQTAACVRAGSLKRVPLDVDWGDDVDFDNHLMLPYARGLRLRTRCAMSSTSGSPFLVITIGLPASATSSISAKYLAFNPEALMMRDMRAKTFMPSHDHGLEARRHPCPAPTRSWLRPPGLHQAGDLRSELVRVAARLIQRSHYFYLHVS